MDLPWAQMVEFCNVDLDFLAFDKFHEISLVVEDAEAVASEHGQCPRFQLSGFWMRVELHECHDIVAQDAPEGVDYASPENRAVQEASDAVVAIGIAPNAWAEPGQESSVCSEQVSIWNCCNSILC
jgi:hypothetical protein